MRKISISALCTLALINTAIAWNNGLGKTPPMGWTTEVYGNTVTEDMVKATAHYMQMVRLDKAGYQFIELAEGWQNAQREANGTLLADTTRFPNGVASLNTNITGSGFTLGIRGNAGTQTCKFKLPGSSGKETQDASDWQAWGVKHLSYANCFNDGSSSQSWTTMQQALTGKSIFYGISAADQENGLATSQSIGNSYRTSQTLYEGSFWWIRQAFYESIKYSANAGPGQWNDLGTLQIGRSALTVWEEQTHFALWAFAKSPLFLSLDFTTMAPEVMQIVTSPLVVALNQDSLGAMPKCIMNCQRSQIGVEVFSVPAKDNGTYTGVLAVNWDPVNEASISLDLFLLGITPRAYYRCEVVNMWFPTIGQNVTNGIYTINKIPPHGNAALKINCKPPNSQVLEESMEESLFLY